MFKFVHYTKMLKMLYHTFVNYRHFPLKLAPEICIRNMEENHTFLQVYN